MTIEDKLSKRKPRARLQRGGTLEQMQEGRKRSLEKAPKKANGKTVTNYKIREVLDAYERFDLEPTARLNKPTERPKFITQPEIRKRLIKYMKEGLPYTTVCKLAGVNRESFIKWLELGKEGYKPYDKFYKEIVKVEAQAELRAIRSLRQHEERDWRPAAWQLERRWPEHWSKQDRTTARIEVQGEVKVTHKDEISQRVINDPQAREAARKLLEGDEFGFERVDKD